MIVFLRTLNTFDFETAEALVEILKERNLISLSLEEVKEEVKKVWKNSDWEDVQCDSEVIQHILEELANGYFSLDWNEDGIFTVGVIDKNKPLGKEGKTPKIPKTKVEFT
jgi:hypothetical protein